ncbi:hypothetical protein C8R45DRAFT_1224173, partial [Mycena sanguinolenta]
MVKHAPQIKRLHTFPHLPNRHDTYAGGVFSGSQHFTVSGGTLTSITKNYNSTPTEPCDFRMVPMMDIDLQREISLETSAANRQRKRPCVRRVYSAKLESQLRKGNMTVAMYQGDGAEEEWRQDVAKYMSIRHPNIIQIYEAASSKNIYAAVFHDDLIPFEDFLHLYRHSSPLTVYVYGFHTSEFYAAENYLYLSFHKFLLATKYTIWIRRSAWISHPA